MENFANPSSQSQAPAVLSAVIETNFEIVDNQGVPIMLAAILREEMKKHQEKPLNLMRAVEQPFEDHFICSICHGIVDTPKECTKCCNLFC